MRLAVEHTAGELPGILFCGGFQSDMQGDKALFLERLCKQKRWQYTRFDYRGHGQSEGQFSQCTLDHWIADTCAVLDQVCQGPQILAGSSMGAWVAIRAALHKPQQVAAMLSIAAAPDFTETLIWEKLDPAQQQALLQGQLINLLSSSDPDQDYLINMPLIESGRRNRLLIAPVALHCPVRLLHGSADEVVPADLSSELLNRLQSTDVTLTIKKGADHRFSDAACLQLIEQTLVALQSNLSKQTMVG